MVNILKHGLNFLKYIDLFFSRDTTCANHLLRCLVVAVLFLIKVKVQHSPQPLTPKGQTTEHENEKLNTSHFSGSIPLLKSTDPRKKNNKMAAMADSMEMVLTGEYWT